MLTLQRASAGSGKTYTLAKTFIRLMISVPDSNGQYRLRRPGETADAVSKILAITFTNKATSEMKERIVAKLADLAGRNPSPDTDYLQDFMLEFSEDESAIREIAREALESVLNNYSDFQISTIDSFFQNVLRTFAYEVDLNDTYQVELDSDLLISIGIDLTMREINAGEADPQTLRWLHRLMEQAAASGAVWNVHLRSSSRRPSVRKSITDAVRTMNMEGFKKNRKEFDEYFQLFPDYSATVDTYENVLTAPVKTALTALHESARNLEKAFIHAGLDIGTDGAGRMESHLRKVIEHHNIMTEPDFKYESLQNKLLGNDFAIFNSRFPKKRVSQSLAATLADAARDFYAAVDNLKTAQNSEEFLLWRIYAPTLSYPAIMHRVRNNIQSFLRDNNLIELADTNTMLSRIIGDDDTPFIYERLGSRLDHFLIDEFQDTSAMQWENIRPLIGESVSRSCQNLIIGDAKQSIYRFRNADPSLITSKVPAQFRRFPFRTAGNLKQENTNHRSCRRIVEFNNLFFLMASTRLDRADSAMGIDISDPAHSFRELYSNVVQYPARQEEDGYVEVRFREKHEDSIDKAQTDTYSYVAPTICRLLERGYRQQDIAILVERNSQGTEIIRHLIDYNSRPDTDRRIDFISDESLHLGESQAVRLIVATLEMVAVSSIPYNQTEENDTHSSEKTIQSERNVRRAGITSMFAYFTSMHPELDPAECVTRFLADETLRLPLMKMLDGLHSVSLTSLVETIIDNFIPASLQASEAPFIAAFQDNVIDYCANYPADAASFLEWWKEKGDKLSIASPEGTDAVRIMTIHKSKGLEFKCVILPEFNIKFGKTKNTAGNQDYLWLKPMLRIDGASPLPPLIPVRIDHQLMPLSPLRGPYLENLFRETMDRLNTAYVAFTRAVEELYIVTSLPKTSSESIPENVRSCNQLIYYFFHPESHTEAIADIDSIITGEERDWVAKSDLFSLQTEEETVITYGIPTSDPAGCLEKDKQRKKQKNISGLEPTVKAACPYSPSSGSLHLKYKSRSVSLSGEEDIDTASSSDPRRRGNLLHSILENVATVSDLPKAIKKKLIAGELTYDAAEATQRQLLRLISHPEVTPWFDGSWTLLRERPILAEGRDWRPDRVMISRDRQRAIVVDYKFGSVEESVYTKKRGGYARQIRGYMKLINQALGIDSTEGYVWYLSRGTVERILPETKG